MPEPLVPVHEPEVIEAGARRRHGDYEKVATTSVDVLEVDGVTLSSRYGKAGELKTMARMVAALTPAQREQVESVWCDSKAGACYTVMLRDCPERVALRIALALEQAALDVSSGHNGIYVQGNAGGDCSLDPNWYWGDEDE